MQMFPILENCKVLKTKLKEQYPEIRDRDLNCNGGKKDEMLRTLQQKLGKSREELRELLAHLS